MSGGAQPDTCGRLRAAHPSDSTGSVEHDAGMLELDGMSGRGWWRRAAASGSLGRLSVRRIPGLRVQHMHNPPVAEILQPFSPKEVG